MQYYCIERMDITTQLTWQYNVNQSLIGLGTAPLTSSQLLRSIKNSLIGFASNPWTIKGSGNGTVFGMDGVDRWVTDADVVFPANTGGTLPRSWMVLKQINGFGSNFDLLIATGQSNNAGFYAAISFSGFTGGSATALPTATQQSILFDGSGFTSNTTNKKILHVTQNDLGMITRVFVYDTVLATMVSCWIFEQIKNPVMNWTTPYLFNIHGSLTGGCASWDNFSGPTFCKSYHNSSIYNIGMTFETCSGSNLLRKNFNPFTQKYDCTKIGVASIDVGFRGYHGIMYDMYWGISSALEVPKTYYNETYAQFGEIIVPWNNSSMVIV